MRVPSSPSSSTSVKLPVSVSILMFSFPSSFISVSVMGVSDVSSATSYSFILFRSVSRSLLLFGMTIRPRSLSEEGPGVPEGTLYSISS